MKGHKKTRCIHCRGGIEFPTDGTGLTVECPHCQGFTVLKPKAILTLKRVSLAVLLAVVALVGHSILESNRAEQQWRTEHLETAARREAAKKARTARAEIWEAEARLYELADETRQQQEKQSQRVRREQERQFQLEDWRQSQIQQAIEGQTRTLERIRRDAETRDFDRKFR